MTRKGIDYSFGRPGGAAIKAAGFEFAVRYLPYPGAGGKGLTAAEIGDLHGNGISIAFVFESTAMRARYGRVAGEEDGWAALHACNTLGIPSDRPVYFAVDFDAQSVEYAALESYFSGAASAMGHDRVGVYGSYDVCDFFHNKGTQWLWQTYAWSGHRRHPFMSIYQFNNGQVLNGAGVDYDEAAGEDFGQWEPPAKETAVTRQEYEDLLLAMFAGKEQVGERPTRGDRLYYAIGKAAEIASGAANSLLETGATFPISTFVLPAEFKATIKVEG